MMIKKKHYLIFMSVLEAAFHAFSNNLIFSACDYNVHDVIVDDYVNSGCSCAKFSPCMFCQKVTIIIFTHKITAVLSLI